MDAALPTGKQGSQEIEKPRTKNAKGQNRTADTSIFSAVLYRLSYLGVCPTIACSPRSVKPLF
jgi:hypothetical protein